MCQATSQESFAGLVPGHDFSHLSKAEIGRVSQNSCQQQRWIFRRLVRFEMCEVPGEAGPAVHLHQQVRDLDVRKHTAQAIPESLGLLRNTVLKRADLESRTVQLYIRQFIFPGESIGLVESTPQQRHSLLDVRGSGGRHSNA